MEKVIKDILSKSFEKAVVDIQGGEAKYTVSITSDEFANKSIIERHKMIYVLLDSYIKSGEIHALTIKSYTFDEIQK